MIVTITTFWDSDAEVWVATSQNLLGLVTEAITHVALVEKLRVKI